MLAVIKNQEINVKVTSVILESDREHPDIMKGFHCSDCGKIAFQFTGNIVLIVPGMARTQIPVFSLCGTCKKRYLICSIL